MKEDLLITKTRFILTTGNFFVLFLIFYNNLNIFLTYNRKKEAWDLLINEAIELISKYKIDGLHLDDAQCWPNLLEANISELERNDTDGTPAYTPEEIFYGKIVIPRTFTGYWMTEYLFSSI